MDAILCAAPCWTPKPCPDHGSPMTPLGRAAPEGMNPCCDNYADSSINPRHLWDEHDSTRAYLDPEGWRLHELNCSTCAPIGVPDE